MTPSDVKLATGFNVEPGVYKLKEVLCTDMDRPFRRNKRREKA